VIEVDERELEAKRNSKCRENQKSIQDCF